MIKEIIKNCARKLQEFELDGARFEAKGKKLFWNGKLLFYWTWVQTELGGYGAFSFNKEYNLSPSYILDDQKDRDKLLLTRSLAVILAKTLLGGNCIIVESYEDNGDGKVLLLAKEFEISLPLFDFDCDAQHYRVEVIFYSEDNAELGRVEIKVKDLMAHGLNFFRKTYALLLL